MQPSTSLKIRIKDVASNAQQDGRISVRERPLYLELHHPLDKRNAMYTLLFHILATLPLFMLGVSDLYQMQDWQQFLAHWQLLSTVTGVVLVLITVYAIFSWRSCRAQPAPMVQGYLGWGTGGQDTLSWPMKPARGRVERACSNQQRCT